MLMGLTANSAYAQISRGDRYSGADWATRSPVLAQHGMAATEQPLATQISGVTELTLETRANEKAS